MTQSFTLVYSDDCGWPVVERFESEAEADEWVSENLGPFEGYNPAPQQLDRPFSKG